MQPSWNYHVQMNGSHVWILILNTCTYACDVYMYIYKILLNYYLMQIENCIRISTVSHWSLSTFAYIEWIINWDQREYFSATSEKWKHITSSKRNSNILKNKKDPYWIFC